MINNDFDLAAWEAFQEAAAEKYDFSTCQRPDGSYYGTGGTCRKGSPVSGVPEKEKKSGSGGDGGAARKEAKASGEVADRKAAARKENEAKKEANARTDSKMSSKDAARVKAQFDAKRQRAAGGQDGPKATSSQRQAAMKHLRREENILLNKQDDNGKLSAADEAKLKRIKASQREYEN